MACKKCSSLKRAEAAERERDEARRERDELKRRIAVGTHCCPDWDGQIVRPDDPEAECCTCKPEDGK